MSQWDQHTYDNLQRYRARPLSELEKRIGDVTGRIETLIQTGARPRILEVGHGYGSVLVQLLKRFGCNIELHAISNEDYWGSWDVIQRNALLMELATERELAHLCRPVVHVADLNLGLPFPRDYFDFIYSQVSFWLLREKLFFLQECCRVLTRGNSASIDVNPLTLPHVIPELANLLDIRAGQQSIDFWTFVGKYTWLSQKRALPRDYLEVRKDANPQLSASLRVALDLSDLRCDWYGVKTIYDICPEADAPV